MKQEPESTRLSDTIRASHLAQPVSVPDSAPAPTAEKGAGFPDSTRLQKPRAVIGNHLVLRCALTSDAAFIVELRTSEKKALHISKTSADVRMQEDWLKQCENDNSQVYFIILNQLGERFGTVRIYDVIQDSFCWGSWILKEGAPKSFSVESALLVYHFALGLGFKRSHFDVKKANVSVWRFHERFGAQRTDETNDSYSYVISLEAICRSLEKYKKHLPSGFTVLP